MKAALVIFTICISYTICQGDKVNDKVYPKKYKPYTNGKILINPAKYEKAKTPPPVSKKPGPTSYTAFQVVGSVPKIIKEGVPDSPYFPIDHNIDQKSRVKKVLPEYPWTFVRNKRSADVVAAPPVDEKKVKPKAEEEKETTAASKAAATGNKEETNVKSTTVKEETKSTTKITTVKQNPSSEKEIERAGKSPNKKAPVLKGQAKPKAKAKAKPKAKPQAKPKPKAALKKKSGRVNSKTKSKPKGKNVAARVKPKAKQAKPKKLKRNQPAKKNNKPKAKPKARAPKAKETRRLTAAREALIEDYPYVVSIQKDEQHWCSGALLNPRLVITTANCLWKANSVSRMEVRAGSRHTNRGGQMAGIQEVMKHPNWGLRKSPDNDVAIMLLDKNIKFSDSVHGVDLPNRAMLPPFDDAWVTSFGAERRDGIYDVHDSTTLQVFHARLMDREKCNNVTMRFSVIVSDNFICLAQSGRQAPCTRDTGAPAVSDGILWGLASWGIRKLCGTERYPAVFSYLASHSNMDFIMNATHYLMSDKRQYPFADRYPGSLMERGKRMS